VQFVETNIVHICVYFVLKNIIAGDSNVVLTGGAENMSQSPFVVRDTRFGTVLGTPIQFEDSLWLGLTDTYCMTPMGVTAENLAEKYSIPREEVDRFALRSQTSWKKGTMVVSWLADLWFSDSVSMSAIQHQMFV
jgi:acetyl-CoA acetyltransferase